MRIFTTTPSDCTHAPSYKALIKFDSSTGKSYIGVLLVDAHFSQKRHQPRRFQAPEWILNFDHHLCKSHSYFVRLGPLRAYLRMSFTPRSRTSSRTGTRIPGRSPSRLVVPHTLRLTHSLSNLHVRGWSRVQAKFERPTETDSQQTSVQCRWVATCWDLQCSSHMN